MAILKIRDENGEVYEIAALRGPQGLKGEDAYAKVVEYGYEGSEEEFYLAMSQNGAVPDKTLTKEGHAADAAVVGRGLALADVALEEHTTNALTHITQAERERWNGAARANTYYATINGDWEHTDDGYFYMDVPVDGIRAGDVVFMDIATGDDNEKNDGYDAEIASVFRFVVSDNSIRVWSRDRIGQLPIRLVVLR